MEKKQITNSIFKMSNDKFMVSDLQFKCISSNIVKVICMKYYYRRKSCILRCNIKNIDFLMKNDFNYFSYHVFTQITKDMLKFNPHVK